MTVGLWAQSEELFTHFMYNRLNFNPAYAGSEGNIDVTAIYRNQWWSGVEGNPKSLNLTAHAPFGDDQTHGAGFSLISDDIGLDKTISVNLSYAYRLKLDENNRLSVGLTPRFENVRRDWNEANLRHGADVLNQNGVENNSTFNIGAGLYLNNPSFYLGVSVPRLLKNSLYVDEDEFGGSVNSYYGQIGFRAPLGKSGKVMFLPNAQVRLNPNVPFDFDLNANFMFIKSIVVGVSYRHEDSFDALLTYIFNNGLRAGVALDFTSSELNRATTGSWELMVGYTAPNRYIVDTRYFRNPFTN